MTDTILVDTSVWVSHLRYGEERLEMMLNDHDLRRQYSDAAISNSAYFDVKRSAVEHLALHNELV